ncbi:DUF1045 domain-containing protein [Acidovorax sp.]|uniref:DUF1045 domain-containing protein n=1 Tax=Acidovorax sp. TaxID=1872122 RepID=UPI00391A7222
MPTTGAFRYAICYAPNPGSLGWLAGSHWLGRCAALLRPLEQLAIDGVAADDLHRLTAAPRRMGWQAPLLPPFALAPGTDWLDLHQAVQRLAHSLAPCALPPLHVERLGDCLALVPAARHAVNTRLEQTAAACRAELQPLMAAAAAQGMDDALPASDSFRFHLPLTGSLAQLDAATQAYVLDAAQDFFADLPVLTFNSLALFAEPSPGADFVLLDHVEMAAA